MFSRFNHAVACIRTSFLLMDYNYSILCVYYILPSHVLMNIWVVSTFWQFVKNAAMNTDIQISVRDLAFQ